MKKEKYEKEKEEIWQLLQKTDIQYKQNKEELKQLTHPNQKQDQKDPSSVKKKMQSRLLVNKQEIKGDGFQGYRKVIQREKTAQSQAEIENKQEISSLSGTQLQTRYIEQWLNDVLKDAQELDMPGILQKPEHQKPLQRYEIDRINLNGFGLSNEIIDRVYRSLFVHSVGFFGILKEATNNIQEGKDFLRINIWKVFQILLECACQTDYKLITQTMEQENVKTISELREKNIKLTQDYMQKDDVLSLKLQRLKTEQNYFESERAKFQDEKMKVYEELQKIQKKIEEEIKLRLFFESKLNSLHHMNMDHESNFTLLKKKYDDLLIENTELQQQFQIIQIENKGLKQYKIQAEEDIKNYQMKEKIEQNNKSLRQQRNQSLILEIDSTSQNLVEQKNQLNIKVQELTMKEQQTIKDKLYLQNKDDQVEIIQTLNRNQLEKISQLEIQIEELKKNKLEYIEANQQNQLLQRQIIYQEDILKDVDKKQNSLYTQIEDLEIIIDTKKNQITSLENMMKNDQGKNSILEKKVHELSCLKDDLERRLKYQIQQCEDLQQEILHLEKIYKNIKKENLSISEEKFKMKIQFEKTLLEYKNVSDLIQEIKTQQNQKELILRQTLNTVTFEKNELVEQNKKDTYKVQYFQDLYKQLQNENIDLQQAKQIQEKELEDLKIQFEQIKEKKEQLNIKCIANEQLVDEQNRQLKKLEGENKSLKQLSQKENLAFETLTKNQKQQFNIVQMQNEDSNMQLSKIQDKMKLVLAEQSKIKKVLGKFGWQFIKFIMFQRGFQEQKLELNIKIQDLGEQVVQQLQIISECNQKIFQLESSLQNRDQQNQKIGEIQSQNFEKIVVLEKIKESQQKQIEDLSQKIKLANEKLNIKSHSQGTQTPAQFYQNTGIDEFSQTSEILEQIKQPSQNILTKKSSIVLKEKSHEIQESQKSQQNQQSIKQTVFQNIVSQEVDYPQKEDAQIEQKKKNKKDKKQKNIQKLKEDILINVIKTPQEILNDDYTLQNLDESITNNQIIEIKSEKQDSAFEYQNNNQKEDSQKDKLSLSKKKYQSIQNSQKSQNITFKIKSAIDKQSSKIQSVKQISSYKEISSNIEVVQDDSNIIQKQDSQIQSLSSSSEQMENSLIYENQVQILKQQENLNQENSNVNINDDSQEIQAEQEYQQIFEIDESHVYTFFAQKSKEQIYSLVKQLNQMNQIKLCGGLGMCFDCRNQHLGKKNYQNTTFQNNDYRIQEIEQSRLIKGTYFKKELQKILQGYMPPTSHTLSTRFFETQLFNNIEDEQRRENQDDFITKASSLQALSNKNINFEDQKAINQTKVLDLARRGLASSNGQSSIKRNTQNYKNKFEDESLKIPHQYSHHNSKNIQKNNFNSGKQKLRSSVANIYCQSKNVFANQGGYFIKNDPAELIVTSGQQDKKNQYNFNSSSLKEFELTNLKKNNNKIMMASKIIQKKLKNITQQGTSPSGDTHVKFQGRNGNIQIQKKSFESILTNQNQMLPSLESLKSEEVHRPKTNQQPQQVRMNKKDELKSSEAYSNIEITKNQYTTGMRSMSQKGRERNLQTQNSIEQLRSQSQLLTNKYEFQLYKQFQIQKQSINQQINEDLNELAINVEQYLTNAKPFNESPNLQQSYLQPNVPNLFQVINKIETENENKNFMISNQLINTVSDANINDTIRENLDDQQSNQNSLIQNNQLGIIEVKVEKPQQQQNQRRVSIMKVKNQEIKKDYKNTQYSLFKNTNAKSNENLGQLMRNKQQQEQQMMINTQNIQPSGVRQIQSSKKEYTTSNDEISKRLQKRLESSRNSELNKTQEQDNHLKIVNDSYQIDKSSSYNYKQAKKVVFSQNNDKNSFERSFYNDSNSQHKQDKQFFENRTKSQVDFYKRNIKKFF